jgi:hypothetical protein
MFKFIFPALLSLTWCSTPADEVKLSGIVIKPEVTHYMYGTHALEENGSIRAALQSNSLDLDAFLGKKVRITGNRVPGYPLSGGPELVEVQKVEIR